MRTYKTMHRYEIKKSAYHVERAYAGIITSGKLEKGF